MPIASATVNQSKSPRVVDGVTYYQILNLIEDATNITDGLFLFQIIDQADASKDTFTRVCNVADLTEYERTRAAAIIAGDSYYRSAALTVQYRDITTAVNAATVTVERVTTLLNEFNTSVNEFEGDILTPVPTMDETLLNQLIAQAEAANDDYEAAVTAQTTAEAAEDTAQAAYDDKSDVFDALDAAYVSMLQCYTPLTAAAVQLDVADSNVDLIFADADYPDNAHFGDYLEDAVTAFQLGYPSFLEGYALVNSARGSVATTRASALTAKNNAATTLNTAVSARIAAEATTAAKLVIRDDLADDVHAIDPDYELSWE